MKNTYFKKLIRPSVWQILSVGFILLILLGSLLLMLPFATREGETTTYINALLISTSATCVTGLTTYDINTHFTLFGQLVILVLIQVGGIGFMTIVSILFTLMKKSFGLHTKNILISTTGESSYLNLNKIMKRIILGTIIIESLGACVLSIRLIPLLGVSRGIYYSIFHSISAFCNAGFDLFGGVFSSEGFVSLTYFVKDPLVIITICFLIIIGGLGFVVWSDLIDNKFKYKKLSLHTKITLIATLVLVVVPTLLILLANYNNEVYSGMNLFEKILASMFNSITPRTAGFNIVDFDKVNNSSYLLILVLMVIGGGSASCAGGIKMTTATLVVLGMISVFRGKKDITLKTRRIDNNLLSQSLAVLTACLIMICISSILISLLEPTASIKQILFETVSAAGTVGLSLSLTPTLCSVSKIIIVLLMYAGRVGIITIALSFAQKKKEANIRMPIENILIG